MPALSIFIWLPAACGLLAALLPARAGATATPATAPGGALRRPASPGGLLALLGSLATLGLAIAYIVDYKAGAGPQHVTNTMWISSLGIHYKLAITGLNVFLAGMAALVFFAAVLAANLRPAGPPQRARLFFFGLALAESAVLGALLAQDLILFVAFFDLMLIPFYFLVGIYGRDPEGSTRVRATVKLVIYTLIGSLLMLAAAIATGVLVAQQTGGHIDFAYSTLAAAPLGHGSQDWIFLFFAAAFLVKMPAFPLHGWMPDGYRAMPIEALMAFSSVLSKVGAYGFLAIVLPLFPYAAVHFQTLMLVIALVSIVYGSVQAFSQYDARLIAGYSSVAQLGFITLGIFALDPQGAQGALLQMLNHGLVVAALLFIVALLAARTGGSEDIREMGGIAFRAPVLASLFLIVALATLAIPGSSNFVGEFLILLGVFKAKLAIAIVAFSGVVMASVYALRLFIRAMHNRVGPKASSREIGLADGLVIVPVLAVVLFLALYPQSALHKSEGSVDGAVAQAQSAAHPPRTALAGGAGSSGSSAAGRSSGGGGETATPSGGLGSEEEASSEGEGTGE